MQLKQGLESVNLHELLVALSSLYVPKSFNFFRHIQMLEAKMKGRVV